MVEFLYTICKRGASHYCLTSVEAEYTLGLKLCIYITLLSLSAVQEYREGTMKALEKRSGRIFVGAWKILGCTCLEQCVLSTNALPYSYG